MDGTHKPDGSIQSVRRALALLSLFSAQRQEWAVTDLARATGLHKSVVTRLMATMAGSGFVVQAPTTRTYRVGSRAFVVGSTYQPYAVLGKLARPILESLTAHSGHATTLGVPDGDHFLIIESIPGIRSVRVAFAVGERPPYHSSSVGQALLAGLSDADVRAMVGSAPLPRSTPHTLDSVEALLLKLQDIRQTGVAITREEAIVGVGGVAAAIIDSSGACVAAIGVAYPTHLVSESEVNALARSVTAAAATLSRQLGGIPEDRAITRDALKVPPVMRPA